jgi:hypothetical protein
MFDIKSFGENLIVKSKNGNQNINSDKQIFFDLVTTFDMLHQRSLKIEKEHGLKLEKYNGLFFLLIENLFYIHYDEWEAELIMWYVYDRVDEDGKLYPMLVINEATNEEEEHIIKDVKGLYSLVQKLSKKIKKKK